MQRMMPSTGTIRAASLPSTISADERSVTSIWASVPRARSRQIAPAVAAGAASRTIASCVAVIAPQTSLPTTAWACTDRGGLRTVRTHHTRVRAQNASHQDRSGRIPLPAPRYGQPLGCEHRPQTDSLCHAKLPLRHYSRDGGGEPVRFAIFMRRPFWSGDSRGPRIWRPARRRESQRTHGRTGTSPAGREKVTSGVYTVGMVPRPQFTNSIKPSRRCSRHHGRVPAPLRWPMKFAGF